MKNRDLIKKLLDINIDADVVVSIGDTFDDVADFNLSWGGPNSGYGADKKDAKYIYINFMNHIGYERHYTNSLPPEEIKDNIKLLAALKD